MCGIKILTFHAKSTGGGGEGAYLLTCDIFVYLVRDKRRGVHRSQRTFHVVSVHGQ